MRLQYHKKEWVLKEEHLLHNRTLHICSTFKEPEKVLEMKLTRSSALLCEMEEYGIIEPVIGYGKGKYRFRKQMKF